MKSNYRLFSVLSALLLIISFITTLLPSFFVASHAGMSTSVTFSEAINPTFVTVLIFNIICLILFLVVLFGENKKTGIVLLLVILFPSFNSFVAVLISGLVLSKSNVNYSFGAAGGWFIATKLIHLIFHVIAIIYGFKENRASFKTNSAGSTSGAGDGSTNGPKTTIANVNGEIPLDASYDFQHLINEGNYCPRCGSHMMIDYVTKKVCYSCRKAFLNSEYEQFKPYNKEISDKHLIHPDVLAKYKGMVSEEDAKEILEKYGITVDRYYELIDSPINKDVHDKYSILASSFLSNSNYENANLYFYKEFFLFIPKQQINRYELVSNPLQSLNSYYHSYKDIEKCEYAGKEKDLLGELLDHYNIIFKGIKELEYVKVEKNEDLLNILRENGIEIIETESSESKEFYEKYGISWNDLRKRRLSFNTAVGHDLFLTSQMLFVHILDGYDDFFIVESEGDSNLKQLLSDAKPNLIALSNYIFRISDIQEVKYKKDTFNTTVHHKASFGDMILGDLAFGESGMLAAAVLNNYDTTSSSSFEYLHITLKPNALSGKTICLNKMAVTSSIKVWNFFSQYTNIATLRAMSDLITKRDEEKKKEAVVGVPSAADEILKYKKLLDMGAITKEEYEEKKKQLLGQ